MRIDNNTTWRMCGLGNNNSSTSYTDIEYAFHMGGGSGTLEIYESGISRGSFGTYAASDRLKVAVENGTVKYYRNGALVYTSTVAPTYPLQVDTSLNTVNSGINNVVITSSLQNVNWTEVSSTIQVTGNSIQKTSGANLWDAGAVSAQMIVAGNGYVEFTPGETQTWRMCGLGNTNSSPSYLDIEHAFHMGGGGVLEIYESGTSRGSFGSYTASDRLRVAVESGVVKYYRNGSLVYTSLVAPKYPLQADTSLNTVNAGVYNVTLDGASLAANPVSYVLQDVQGSTRAVMSGTSVVARHDFLPFGEELGAGIGLRTTGQGFGAMDKIRQRYAMTERDDATGLDHTWWRKYENLSGRWTSPDPYLGSMSIGDPQSFNRYAYVRNDPVNFIDPMGLDGGPNEDCDGKCVDEKGEEFPCDDCPGRQIEISDTWTWGDEYLPRQISLSPMIIDWLRGENLFTIDIDLEIQRRINEGKAWDRWHAWVICNTPIMNRYNDQLKKAHDDAFWRDVGAGIMTFALLASAGSGPDTDIGTGGGPSKNTMSGNRTARGWLAFLNVVRVAQEDRDAIKTVISNYNEEILKTCGPKPPRP